MGARKLATVRLTPLAVALALTAVLLRAFVPAGFMPSTAAVAQTGVPLVICDPQHPLSLTDLSGLHPEPAAPGKAPAHDGACPFSAAGALATPVKTFVPVVWKLAVSFAAQPVQRDLRPGRGLAAPPPPKTGPPQILS